MSATPKDQMMAGGLRMSSNLHLGEIDSWGDLRVRNADRIEAQGRKVGRR